MKIQILEGRVLLLDKVYDEIMEGNDELKEWLVEMNPLPIKYKNPLIINTYAKIINHIAEANEYNHKALDNWARGNVSDPWLIACAKVFGYTIVTFEKYSKNLTNVTSKPKIPNICVNFGVDYIDFFEMLKLLNFKF